MPDVSEKSSKSEWISLTVCCVWSHKQPICRCVMYWWRRIVKMLLHIYKVERARHVPAPLLRVRDCSRRHVSMDSDSNVKEGWRSLTYEQMWVQHATKHVIGWQDIYTSRASTLCPKCTWSRLQAREGCRGTIGRLELGRSSGHVWSSPALLQLMLTEGFSEAGRHL